MRQLRQGDPGEQRVYAHTLARHGLQPGPKLAELLRFEPEQHRVMAARRLGLFGRPEQRHTSGCGVERGIEHGKARGRDARPEPAGEHRAPHIPATDNEKLFDLRHA